MDSSRQPGGDGNIQLEPAEEFLSLKDFAGGTLHRDSPRLDNQHPVRLRRFRHVVGDGDDGHPPLMKPSQHLQDLPPPMGVQHAGRLIKHQTSGLHGQHAGDGNPLLLSPRQVMGRAVPIRAHADGFQGGIDPFSHLPRGDPDVFQTEGHVVLHDGGHDLIVRMLKHHPHSPPDLPPIAVVLGVKSGHIHIAFRRFEDAVEMLDQRRFSRAVVADDGHIFPRVNVQGNVPKDAHDLLAVQPVVKGDPLHPNQRLLHQIPRPPSTFRISPVTIFARSEARYKAARAISSGCTNRPRGTLSKKIFFFCASAA